MVLKQLGPTLAEVEREHILRLLNLCDGNRTHAAKSLNISLRCLRLKLHGYAAAGIEVPPPRSGGFSMDGHVTQQGMCKYKINWRVEGESTTLSEAFGTFEATRKRGHELLEQYDNLVASVWNEDETWQVVTPAGFREWCIIP